MQAIHLYLYCILNSRGKMREFMNTKSTKDVNDSLINFAVLEEFLIR